MVAWAKTARSETPPLVLTMATFLRELSDAVLADVPSVNQRQATMLLESAALSLDTSVQALGIRLANVQRWRAEGALELVDDEALTARQRERIRQVRQVINAYESLQESIGFDAIWRLEQAASVISAKASAGVPVHMRLRDVEQPIEGLILAGVSVLPRLDRIVFQLLATCGWNVAIRWADALSVSHVNIRSDQQYMSSVAALIGSQAMSWNHEEHASEISTRIHVVPCSSGSQQDRAVIGIAKEHCLLRGQRPQDVAIVPVANDGTELLLSERAWAAGLPVADINSVVLSSVPIVAACIAAANVVVDGWRRADIERLIRTGVLDDVVPNAHTLMRIAREYRISGGDGAEAWLHDLRERAAWLRADPSGDSDADAIRALEVALDVMQNLRRSLPCDTTPCNAAEAQIRIERHILDSLNLDRTANIWRQRDEASGRPSVSVEALRVLRESLRETLTLAQRLSDHEVDLAVHLNMVFAPLQSMRVRTPDARIGGVQVVSPDDTTARHWPVLITPGWTEESLSQARPDDLEEIVLPGEREARLRRSALSILCAAATDSHVGADVYVLWPRTVDGVHQMPSVMLDEFAELGAAEGNSGLHVLDGTLDVHLEPAEQRMVSAQNVAGRADERSISVAGLSERAAKRLAAVLDAPYSPSKVDMARACAYKFAMHYVMRIREDVVDEMRQTPLERGTMLHAIVAEFLSEIIEEQRGSGVLGASLLQYTIEELWTRLQAKAEAATSGLSHAYADVERRALFGTETDAGLLEIWLSKSVQMAQNLQSRVVAVEFDVNDERIELDGTTIPMTMRIDRIDVLPDGTLLVIDYKNSMGSIPSAASINGGLASQMVFYRRAALQWASQQTLEVPNVIGMYVPLGTKLRDSNIDDAIRYGDDAPTRMMFPGRYRLATPKVAEPCVREAVEHMRNSILPILPESATACAHCSYAAICRINELGTWAS